MRITTIMVGLGLLMSAACFAQSEDAVEAQQLLLASDGLVRVKSALSVKDTANKLEAILKQKGMNVFARIDHGGAANQIDVPLRPTELVIFGNPKVGSPLMACKQQVGIDLPQKMLISESANGDVWLTYNDPVYLFSRHNISGCDTLLGKITQALKNIATAATHK
ncbi:DUF302 domain-containing protein [Photobacterium aphoticum]|nr:DUF302 domain-containing protein [Photobacterium aphoticum]PSU59333.1 DUF302 domain-containing protein [Photobacterium aphoticum]